MLWLGIFLASFLLFAVYTFFAPVTIIVSSSRGIFRITLFRLASARLYITENTVMAEISVTFWKKNLDLLAQQGSAGKKKKSGHGSGFHPPLRKIRAVLRSFRVTGFIDIDTGSMPLNGILYPHARWIRSRGLPLYINFRDELAVELNIRNSMARMVWAYVSS